MTDGPAYTDRIAFHRDRLRRTKRTKRAILAEAARLAAILDARDVAYRRLVAHNARLEADRRFAEAAGAILTAWRSTPVPASPSNAAAELADVLGRIVDRFDELELDHAAQEVDE